MAEYRIIKHNKKGDIHYIVEKKRWLFWLRLYHDKYTSLEYAHRLIYYDSLESYTTVLNPDKAILNKIKKEKGEVNNREGTYA